MEKELTKWAEKQGHRIAWFDASILQMVFEEFEHLRKKQTLSQLLYDNYLSWLQRPEILAQAKSNSIILIAIRRPAHLVTFDYRNKSYDLVLPPTYHNYAGLFEEIKKELMDFKENNIRFEILKAPLKTIASWTGFTKYGRNNIAYIEGFGSYFQLLGFVTDAALGDSATTLGLKPSAMDECKECRVCRRACPTGAICEDRFLLRAERCLTFFSELEGDLPEAFGAVQRPCLVGCLACQECCPKNKGLLRFDNPGVRFSPEETAAILGEDEDTSCFNAISAKISGLKLSEFPMTSDGPNSILKRNLSAVLKCRASL